MSPHGHPCRDRACPRCTRDDTVRWAGGSWATDLLAPQTPVAPEQTCELYSGVAGRVCGSTDQVRRFLYGWRCATHAPPQPRPSETTPETPPSAGPAAYGTATDDPLGRTVPGTARSGFIPRHP